MSYTSMYGLDPEKTIDFSDDIKEFRNSHGAAMVMWMEFAEAHGIARFLFDTSEAAKLWKIAYQPEKEPLPVRRALALTFDFAIVYAKDYATAADDIDAFLAKHPIPQKRANHWPAIAEVFRSAPDYPAIGFYMTSTGDDCWEPRYDDEDTARPFDWSKTFDVFKEIT